jgi:hypothetical protein
MRAAKRVYVPRSVRGNRKFKGSAAKGRTYLGDLMARLNTLQKNQNVVILSEAKNLSVFLCLHLDRREILRFAQNDKRKYFFRGLWSCGPHGFLVLPQPLGPRALPPAFLRARKGLVF